MNGMSAGFFAAFGTLGTTAGRDTRSSLRMMESSGGAARLVFQSADCRLHTAAVSRWLAVVRTSPRGRSATRVIWLLDGSSVAWAGGQAPDDLYRGAMGLDEEANPVLWFHARGGVGSKRAAARKRAVARSSRTPRHSRSRAARRRAGESLLVRSARWTGTRLRGLVRLARAPWAFTAAGVFGAGGIVDGARVRVSRWPIGRHARLRMAVDTRVWELSVEHPASAPGPWFPAVPSLSIAADGVLRPLDLEVIRQWL